MACTITRPDPQVLFNRVKDMFSANVLGGGQVIPESNEWYVVANDYAMQEQLYAIADQMWRETNPETACCENLVAMAARNGVFPKPATFAQTYVKLTGDPNASVPSPLEVATSVGTFVSTGTMPTNLDHEGHAVFRAKASAPGSAYNSNGTVTTGALTTTVPGINTEVEICGGYICGGAEAEDCEAFRQRYIKRLAYKPRATSAWIQEQLLMYPCVTRVCERAGNCCKCGPDNSDCGCLACSDKLEFYVLMGGSFPCGIPPQNIVNDINLWLFGARQGYGEGLVEIGVCGKIYAPIALPVDIIIDILGCPTVSQKQQIEQDIADFFSTVCPSEPLKLRQIELIVSQVMGANVDVFVQFDTGEATIEQATVDDCGNLDPACDQLPCLGTVTFVSGGSTDVNCG